MGVLNDKSKVGFKNFMIRVLYAEDRLHKKRINSDMRVIVINCSKGKSMKAICYFDTVYTLLDERVDDAIFQQIIMFLMFEE